MGKSKGTDIDICTLPKNAAELFEAGLVLIQG